MEISEPQKKDGVLGVELISVLLELSAIDDLTGFKHAVEEEGRDVDEASLWYGRIIGCKKMGFVERTPLMVAAMFGSTDVLNYILQTRRVDVNRACGSDGATALHCAAASGSTCSHEVIRLLVDSSADITSADAHGNQPVDLIAPCLDSSSKSIKKSLEATLKGAGGIEVAFFESNQEGLVPRVFNDANSTEKKEYPVDPSIPDIKTGIYGTDEFRMYTFKVKPCSRAYSHDWTECPFVHPGENARRRDPRKYHYSCVPCPEFRKGACNKGDACEYAHGVFESWLHPAQYRTRLCKDETNCTRRVCFFAHKLEELRPLYASTGSAVPSPRSFSSSATAFDIASISPLVLGSPSLLMPSTSTPPSPMTPTAASSSMDGDMWPNPISIVPPTLQLPGSRLRTSLSARDVDIEAQLLGLENQRRRQQLLEELAGLSSPSGWNSSFTSAGFASSGDRARELSRLTGMNLNKVDDVFSSLDPSLLSRLQGVLLGSSSAQLHSTTGMQICQNTKQQLLSSYSNVLSCSPIRASSVSSSSVRASVFGVDASGSPAVSNSRLSAFAKRSQSFIDRSAVNHLSGFSSPAASREVIPSHISDWGSPDGKLEWGVQGEELNKLRKSASFRIRSNGSSTGAIKDSQTMKPTQLGFNEQQQKPQHLDPSGSEAIPSWLEQLYMEQEQIVA